ncbi:helix-turn-helix domain-containing protein [Polaromonas naphthalenivorans]|uniref:helix-turn-helix domain-containing protein n=1 Tax=Polaromonas naphthalenivorans TaxID=216465 RepID=UPI00059D296D
MRASSSILLVSSTACLVDSRTESMRRMMHIGRITSGCIAARAVSRTAELLGISRKTLWDKMKRLEISA